MVYVFKANPVVYVLMNRNQQEKMLSLARKIFWFMLRTQGGLVQ